jgi:hypothetical protein
MLVQKRLATTTDIKIPSPSKNIGLRPTISADLGNINEPMKQPAINEDPREPIYT